MILRYLIEKEFKQLKRNSFLPRLILMFPVMMMLVMPWAATLEIEDLRIAIIDNDHSPSSQRLVHQIEASRYFQLTETPATYKEGMVAIEKDEADIILRFRGVLRRNRPTDARHNARGSQCRQRDQRQFGEFLPLSDIVTSKHIDFRKIPV